VTTTTSAAAAATGGQHMLECFYVDDETCPWNWCAASATASGQGPMDLVQHATRCCVSKSEFSISWAHTRSREELWEEFGYDPWRRGEKGEIVGVLKKHGHSKPLEGWEPTAAMWKEWGYSDEEGEDAN
jgi:hypothetical protein